jgi:S1/P1 Nuclease
MRPSGFAFAALLAAAVLSLTPVSAQAWQRPGHAASAAMAYDELSRTNPQVVRAIVAIMESHPDKARFDAALAGATGQERERRLFMQIARWPDDVRETSYDQPSWHYWMSPYASPAAPPPHPPHGTIGEARQAFALQRATAGDSSASDRERAMAICWVFHVLQDVHQPLHATQIFSADYPDGDKGGSRSFVKMTADAEPTTFHRFWDESVLTASASVADVESKARDLAARYPRQALPELKTRHPADRRIEAWAREESFPLARSVAYEGGKVRTGKSLQTAVTLPPEYVSRVRAGAERRLAVASYRLADVLTELYGAP